MLTVYYSLLTAASAAIYRSPFFNIELPSMSSNIIDSQNRARYSFVDSMVTPAGTLTALQSTCTDEPCWDSFLSESSYSHFYQTSMWGRVRTLDGWQPLITLITLGDEVIGGFQMLYRSKRRIGKIGLILKGPVLNSNDSVAQDFVMNVVKKVASNNRIRALIIQPPDKDRDMENLLKASGFSGNHLEHAVKNNTIAIDLTGGEEAIFKAIKRTKRQNINMAARKGVCVREGNSSDLSTFFDYMSETCRRQEVPPSPSNKAFLDKMWQIFSPTGNVKIFIAEYEKEDVSSLIVIPFGNMVYLWKFGLVRKKSKIAPQYAFILGDIQVGLC